MRVTCRAVENANELVFHPPILTLGIGCERGCDPAEIAALAEANLAQAGLAGSDGPARPGATRDATGAMLIEWIAGAFTEDDA